MAKTTDHSIDAGLDSGSMFRIPREFCDGDHPMRLEAIPEMQEWLSARTSREDPTHRIIKSWGLIIEFFDDDFKFEYMLTWTTQAEWPEFQKKEKTQ